VASPQQLLAVVDTIGTEPPYSYAPGEIDPAVRWLPGLLRDGGKLKVAYVDDDPVGYFLALPLPAYGKLAELADQLASNPMGALYVAELGVAAAHRHQGIALKLARASLSEEPAEQEWVVRTLAINSPAIALYQRLGFRLLDRPRQLHRGRERVFLVRSPPGSNAVRSTHRGDAAAVPW